MFLPPRMADRNRNNDFPKLQILTVEDLLNGKQVQLPPSLHTFKQAQRVSDRSDQQMIDFGYQENS